MKKLLCALLAALMALSAVTALAERTAAIRKPTNPHFDRVRALPARLPTMDDGLSKYFRRYLSNGDDLAVGGFVETGDSYTGRTWTVQATGGSGDYQYAFFLVDEDGETFFYRDFSGENSFTYAFVTPGAFTVWCEAMDSDGALIWKYADFTVEADADHPALDTYVASVLEECRAAGCAGDWETALWLHDWLIDHVVYDTNYSYYGAQDAIVRGLCVCDGYRKAYSLLLDAAGIESYGVTSRMINHAWNAVRLDGEWYHVDPTWDDGDQGDPKRIYFCLPDALMAYDHPGDDLSVTCTAYADNYYIRTGEVSRWVDPVREGIRGQLDEHAWRRAFDLEPAYIESHDENGNLCFFGVEPGIAYGLAAHAISDVPWSAGEAEVMLSALYDDDLDSMLVEVQVEDGTLILPASLLEVHEEAFYNDPSVMAVRIPYGAVSIGALAFANCPNLWVAFIPDSVTEIDATAFGEQPKVNVVCSPDSAAEQFATERGLTAYND